MAAFKSALQNISRNIWLSLVTIIIIFLMVFCLGLILSLNIVADELTDSLNQKMDIGVYLNTNAPQDQTSLLKSELENMKEVKELAYISPEESLAQFTAKHQNNPIIIKSLQEIGENPFGPSLKIKLYQLDDFDRVMEVINKSQYQNLIYNKDFYNYKQLLDFFSGLKKKIYSFGLILEILLVFVAALVISTTIRIGIYSRQKEIKIMRLVGATNFTIQKPFLIETCLDAILGWGAFLFSYLPLIKLSSPYLKEFLGFNFDLASYLQANAFSFLGSLLIFSLIIAIISSWLATKKYLK